MRLLYLWRLSRALKQVTRTRQAYEAALGRAEAIAPRRTHVESRIGRA